MQNLNINNNLIPELEGLGLNELREEPDDDVEEEIEKAQSQEIKPIPPLTAEELETELPPIELDFTNDEGVIIPERISLKIQTPEHLKALPFFYKRVLFNLLPKSKDYPETLPMKKSRSKKKLSLPKCSYLG